MPAVRHVSVCGYCWQDSWGRRERDGGGERMEYKSQKVANLLRKTNTHVMFQKGNKVLIATEIRATYVVCVLDYEEFH